MPTIVSKCVISSAAFQEKGAELRAIETRIETLGLNVNAVETEVQDHVNKLESLNSDAEITDDNVARLGCRITNIEKYLQGRSCTLV